MTAWMQEVEQCREQLPGDGERAANPGNHPKFLACPDRTGMMPYMSRVL